MSGDGYTALRRAEEFVTVTDGDRRYYGGDQDWFPACSRRYAGCGIVAAANLTAYLLEPKDGRANIYTKEQFLLHMEEMARYVKLWTLPLLTERADRRAALSSRHFGWALGVWPAGRLIRGVVRYADRYSDRYDICHDDGRSCISDTIRRGGGTCLKPLRFHRKCFAGSAKNLENAVHFIRDALKRDCPPLLLIGFAKNLRGIRVDLPGGGGWVQADFSLHWVVVTALSEDGKEGAEIKVSTWGGSAWLPLSACFDTGFLPSRLCCFMRG